VLGVGLVALDVVVEQATAVPTFYAGGTCGNVLAILSYLGWRAMPVARLGPDVAGEMVSADLHRWGVDLTYANLKPQGRTPVILERVRMDRRGIPYHTFSFSCHGCGTQFPGFQPVMAHAVEHVLEGNPEPPSVLFIDRVSTGAVLLAERWAEAGSVVVFEPQRVEETKLFRRLLRAANVIKYSHERIEELPARDLPTVTLEIQTLGRGGLRLRTTQRGWHHMDAEPVATLRDAAGSGDWLTAGLIHTLCGFGDARRSFDESNVETALRIGQRLAAWNCGFLGARGGMYSNQRQKIVEITHRSKAFGPAAGSRATSDDDAFAAAVCARCSSGTNVKRERVSTAGDHRRRAARA
jgi:fructokinase